MAHSTRSLDPGAKLAEYERAGVQEYVVRLLTPAAVRWRLLQAGELIVMAPHADGGYRWVVSPGFWLDTVADSAYRLTPGVAPRTMRRSCPG